MKADELALVLTSVKLNCQDLSITRLNLKRVKLAFSEPITGTVTEMNSVVNLLREIFVILQKSMHSPSIHCLSVSSLIVCTLVSEFVKATDFDILQFWPLLVKSSPGYENPECVSQLISNIGDRNTTSWISARILYNMVKSSDVTCSRVAFHFDAGTLEHLSSVLKSKSDFTTCVYLTELLGTVFPSEIYASGAVNVLQNCTFKNFFQLKLIEIYSKPKSNISYSNSGLTVLQFASTEMIIVWFSGDFGKSLKPMFFDMKRLISVDVDNFQVTASFCSTPEISNPEVFPGTISITIALKKDELLIPFLTYWNSKTQVSITKLKLDSLMKYLNGNPRYYKSSEEITANAFSNSQPRSAAEVTPVQHGLERTLPQTVEVHAPCMDLPDWDPHPYNSARLAAAKTNEEIHSRPPSIRIDTNSQVKRQQSRETPRYLVRIHLQRSKTGEAPLPISTIPSKRPLTVQVEDSQASEVLHVISRKDKFVDNQRLQANVTCDEEDVVASMNTSPLFRKRRIGVVIPSSFATQIPKYKSLPIAAKISQNSQETTDYTDDENSRTEIGDPTTLRTAFMDNESTRENISAKKGIEPNEKYYAAVQDTIGMLTSNLINKIKSLESMILVRKESMVDELNQEFEKIELKHRHNLKKLQQYYEQECEKVFGK